MIAELANIAPYGFVGVGMEAIARDLFLDGTLFQPSVRVAHTGVVTEWELGAGVHLRRFGVEYRAVTRSREYPAGPRTHAYGSIVASWRLR